MQMFSAIFIYPVIFCQNQHGLALPKPSARTAKYCAGRGVEGNKIYMGNHDLNRILPKAKREQIIFAYLNQNI